MPDPEFPWQPPVPSGRRTRDYVAFAAVVIAVTMVAAVAVLAWIGAQQ